MVGIGGLEPPTSSLSEMRSNQLSYMPIKFQSTQPADLPDLSGRSNQLSYKATEANFGDAGLELATSWSQTKHSSHLS